MVKTRTLVIWIVLLILWGPVPSPATGPKVCEDEVDAAYLAWVVRIQDHALREKACKAAKALDSTSSLEALKAAEFFHSIKAEEVLLEALSRNKSDYEQNRILDFVVDLAEQGAPPLYQLC